MKKIMATLICMLLCLAGCCALADDYGEAVVDAPSGKLHLREEPTSDSDSMGLYFTGTQVTCKSDPDGDWVEVKIGRERGYMKGKYLKTGSRADKVSPRFQQGRIDATNYARLRKGPSTEYQFICKMNDGDQVTVMGETDEHWYYVKYGREMGFVSSGLVRLGGSSSQSSSQTSAVTVEPAAPRTWKKAYLEWLESHADVNQTYDLLYVNNDSIPELAVHTGAEAGGCQILTYGTAGLQVLQTQRLHFTYVKRGNLLCNSDGHMDSYYDYVYTIRDGRWQCIAKGLSWGYQGEFNEVLGRYICQNYQWNDRMVSIAEYLNALSQVYPSQQAIEPSFGYDWGEIMVLLEE